MHGHELVSLASIVVLGIGSQWLAWRLHLPSILLLLLAGFAAGPLTGLVDPDKLLGDTLFPVVSVSVGIILFEGGLTLRLDEIAGVRRVIFRLISVGMIVTWIVDVFGAYVIVGMDFELAMLIGAIFVVSGPTVVVPLLNFVRPRGQVGSILKWEGILIDPVGATLAVLVFEVLLTEQIEGTATSAIITGIVRTLVVGGGIGTIAALLMIPLFRRYWVPEHLQNPVAVMFIVGAFALSNELQTEAGLLTTTVMGIILANQKAVSVSHISQFKEDLGVLLLSSLFIILAARLELESLSNISFQALIYLGLLIFVGRPLAVFLSTTGSKLTWQERVFLAWLAPRGIVAVSVASLFALELGETGYEGADQLVPLTFLIVVGTVATYGLTASRVARWLGLAQADPQGVVILGAHSWARKIAAALSNTGLPVVLLDSNWTNINRAKAMELHAEYHNVLSEGLIDELELSNKGYMLALTSNDEVNSLATLRFGEIFDKNNVYQLTLQNTDVTRKEEVMLKHSLCGRCLFDTPITHAYLSERFARGAEVAVVELSDECDYAAFREHYGKVTTVSLFRVSREGKLSIFSVDETITPQAGDTVIAIVNPVPEPFEVTKTDTDSDEAAAQDGSDDATARPPGDGASTGEAAPDRSPAPDTAPSGAPVQADMDETGD